MRPGFLTLKEVLFKGNCQKTLIRDKCEGQRGIRIIKKCADVGSVLKNVERMPKMLFYRYPHRNSLIK